MLRHASPGLALARYSVIIVVAAGRENSSETSMHLPHLVS